MLNNKKKPLKLLNNPNPSSQNSHKYVSHFIASCGPDQFQCKSGVCVHADSNECDGPCITREWEKNGQEDCTDGSDEDECEWLR